MNGLGAVKPSTPEGEVERVLSLYGSTMKTTQAPDGVTHLEVKPTNHGKLQEVLSAPDNPFGTIRATSRNTLEFSHRGQQFSVSHHS